MSGSGLAMVVGGLSGRDVMASDGFAQMRRELAVFARVKLGLKLERQRWPLVSIPSPLL